MTSDIASIAKVTSTVWEKRKVVTNATIALMTASGGDETAMIERTKKPLAMAKVTNDGSASWSEPTVTLDVAHSAPVAARYPHISRITVCGPSCNRRQSSMATPADKSSASDRPSGT